MFSKFFKRKSLPQNNGKEASTDTPKSRLKKSYEVVLSNMEDTPVYALTHQLTIGSEIGNIVISDPSISPRHVTFNLQDEVVSLIDHGSVAGTLINGKKVDPGKQVILEESDIVMAGDLEVRFKVTSATFIEDDIPETPNKQAEKTSITSVDVIKDRLKSFESKNAQKKNKNNNNKNKKSALSISAPTYSANAIIRVLAVGLDLLLAYSILVIFYPFDDVREFIDFVPASIAELLEIEWGPFWDSIREEHRDFFNLFSDIGELIPQDLNIIPVLILFGIIRLISTLLFGVSVSELCLGVRPTGNGIWARVGGVIRVIFGFITWPFIIFDLPSIISRKTLKDFLSLTNIAIPSKIVSILGVIFYLPIIVAFALLSPLLQGLELPHEIPVDDVIQLRARVATPSNAPVPSSVEDLSRVLGVQLTFRTSEVSLFPKIKFVGQKEKTKLKTGLIVYHRDIQKKVEFELLKTFDLKRLLSIGMKGNFFLYEKYPQIYNYVYEPPSANPVFKKRLNARDQSNFAMEVIQFTKMALSVSPETVLDYVQTETPLLKGILEFKASLLSLIEYKDFDKIGVLKIGNTHFLKISYGQQKPFDLIIPLLMSEGRIFRVSYENKETASEVSSKLYKFTFDKSNWLLGREESGTENFTTLKILDYFSSPDFKEDLLKSAKAQAFYAYIFEASGTLLKSGDQNEIDIWKNEVKSILTILKALPDPKLSEGEENSKEKLIQNFSDMVDALENSNYDYFGVTNSESV